MALGGAFWALFFIVALSPLIGVAVGALLKPGPRFRWWRNLAIAYFGAECVAWGAVVVVYGFTGREVAAWQLIGWLLVLLAPVVAAIAVIAAMTLRVAEGTERRSAQCRACGYPIASPRSQRCPECGQHHDA